MKGYKLIINIFFILLVSLVYCQDKQDKIVLKGQELFGDLKARHIGPALMSGRFIDLEPHPTNDRVIFAGAAGGGVWKSANGGATFQPIFDKHAQSIGAIEVDPNNPDKVIWVGTGEIWTRNSVSIGDGLYKTTDGGVNWKKVGFGNSERIASIIVHPDNSDIVYVGVLGALWGDSDVRGVYKTTDGGENWEKLLYLDETTGCSDLIMDPDNPDIMYASMWEFRRTGWSFNSGGENSALYKSTDGGKTWDKIHKGFPEGKLGRIAVAVAPSSANILYAVIESEKDEDKGLYRSEDRGKSWTHLNKDFGLVVRPFYFSRIVVDPRDPDVVIKGGLYGSISRDGGKTFKSMGDMHADIHDIIFDVNDSDRMYVATDGGVYRTWDGGVTMEIVENIPVSQFYHISLDNKDPYNVYGGLQDNGSWYGPSSSPGGVEARDWKRVGVGDGFRVLRHPSKPIIYSEMQGAEKVWRYDIEKNQTKTIQPLPENEETELRFNWNAPIVLSPSEDDRIYIGSQFLHVSDDMGDSWRRVSPDLTTDDPKKQNQDESGGLSVDNSGAENHCTIFTIAESPVNEKVIWVGTDDGNVQITKDGGKTWTNTIKNIEGLPENTWVSHIEASVHGEGKAYAVFDGHTQNDMNPYVYKTTDYGQTWKSIATDDIYGFTRCIQEDYEKENILYAGTEFGLFITIDGGENWSRFTKNMPATAVHYIDLHQQTNDLVLGTHGRGVIIIDDISPLRQINQEVLARDVHFFETKPTVIKEESGFGGGSTETQFVGANPTSAAKIIYYLKKRHIFGKMNMEIFDAHGEKVTEISPGKNKGINLVTWNYRIRPPKMAKGKSFAFGGFTQPRVPAGEYKVVLTKGKKTYETSLRLINDPSSLLTEEERNLLHKTTMDLYATSEALAYLVYKIDAYITHAEKLKKEDPDAKKVSQNVLDRLNNLKEKLVVTTGDNYVGRAEPKLRGKLAELYSKIASGYVPPSPPELKNMELLKSQFEEQKAEFDKIKRKELKKLMKYMEKKEMPPLKLKTYQEFIGD